MEQIPDTAIAANARADADAKTGLGISGRAHRLLPTGNPNRNGNDGTIARFGWKAQNKSLLLFSGEAYNVEMGITNELFQSERDETPSLPVRPGAQRRHERRRLDAVSQRRSRSSPTSALPGAADAVRHDPGRQRSIGRGPRAVRRRRLRALPHADASGRASRRWPR